MKDAFDRRRFLLDIADREERARTIHECGWAGDPAIDDIEATVAGSDDGPYQRLLAAQYAAKA